MPQTTRNNSGAIGSAGVEGDGVELRGMRGATGENVMKLRVPGAAQYEVLRC